MDYLKVPNDYTRASLASSLARLISSLITPRAGHSSLGAGRSSMWLLKHFIYSVTTSAQSKISALLVALTYLNRVKASLDPNSFGPTLVCERIFIAALVLATKYTEDLCRRNPKWARITRILTAREITSAELQLLHALEWNLSITEEDVSEQTSCIYGVCVSAIYAGRFFKSFRRPALRFARIDVPENIKRGDVLTMEV